jgi:hypothetical protein
MVVSSVPSMALFGGDIYSAPHVSLLEMETFKQRSNLTFFGIFDKITPVSKASGYKGEINLNRSLYAAGPEAYFDVMHDLSDEYVRVLIVGHNPGLEEVVEMLTGEIQLM